MELTFSINKNTATVFEYLSDMQKFVQVHPVIFKIDELGNNKYMAHETLKLAFIPFTFIYPVAVEAIAPEKTIRMRAKVMKMVNIEICFVLSDGVTHTTIKETIKFKSLLPVKFIMQAIFRTQHSQLFKNMEGL